MTQTSTSRSWRERAPLRRRDHRRRIPGRAIGACGLGHRPLMPRCHASRKPPVLPSHRETEGTPMRRLMLLRHAKSDWAARPRDHDRPLNPRGREAAPKMGAYMARHALVPDLIVASTGNARDRNPRSGAAGLRQSRRKSCSDPRIYEAGAERAARHHQGDAAHRAQPAAGRPQSRAGGARLPADRVRRRGDAPAPDREIPDRRPRGDRFRARRLGQAASARPAGSTVSWCRARSKPATD